MATAAFKSNTKRGTTKTPSSSNSHPNSTHTNHSHSHSNSTSNRILRRSRSVSAISRATFDSIPSEFSNRCDNPLFSSSSPAQADVEMLRGTNRTGGLNDRRGRSITRTSAPKAGIGRSVSRGRHGSYQSEQEEMGKLSNPRRQSGRMSSLTTNAAAADPRGRARSSRTTKSHCHVTDFSEDDSACSVQFGIWGDGISNGSFSEAEEKTAVHEQRKSLGGGHWRNDSDVSGMYETVRSQVRRAFSDIESDLRNSEERARKLREDLAVEEHHGLELSRILKQMVPETKTSNSQRSSIRRRTSSERKNVSKRLSEEAMAYFDECVSISTFESSDFSAPEDLFHSSVGTTNQQVNSSILATYGQESSHTQTSNDCDVLMHGHEDSGLKASSRTGECSIDQSSRTWRGHRFMFSAAETLSEMNGPHNDIKSYVKHFMRDANRDEINADIGGRSRSYDADDYELHGCSESFLFDKLLFRNRIESGSLHLCGGGVAILF